MFYIQGGVGNLSTDLVDCFYLNSRLGIDGRFATGNNKEIQYYYNTTIVKMTSWERKDTSSQQIYK